MILDVVDDGSRTIGDAEGGGNLRRRVDGGPKILQAIAVVFIVFTEQRNTRVLDGHALLRIREQSVYLDWSDMMLGLQMKESVITKVTCRLLSIKIPKVQAVVHTSRPCPSTASPIVRWFVVYPQISFAGMLRPSMSQHALGLMLERKLRQLHIEADVGEDRRLHLEPQRVEKPRLSSSVRVNATGASFAGVHDASTSPHHCS